MNLLDYEKYYHSGSEFIIPRDEFEKIIEENQRLNNVLNELEKWLEEKQKFYGINQQGFSWGVAGDCLNKLKELKERDK